MRRLRGVITVYAGVVTVLIIAVGLALLESARFYVCSSAARRYADLAAEMTFSQYCRPLSDRYDLFVFDAGSDYAGLKTFDGMLQKNLEKEEGGRFLSMYASADTAAQAKHNGLESDGWSPLMKQVRKYEKYRMADIAASELKELFEGYKDTESGKNAQEYADLIEAQGAQQAQAEADAAAQAENAVPDAGAAQPADPGEGGAVKAADPRKGIGQWLKGNLLQIVMGDQPVSSKSADISSCTFQTGEAEKTDAADEFEDYQEAGEDLSAQSEKAAADGSLLTDDLLLDVYILDKFGCLTEKPKDDTGQAESALDYEREFIIFGHGSDEENLESAFAAIDGIRLMMNLLYLRTDPDRIREVAELSTAIGAALPLPGASLIVELLLTLCWAGAEAAVDCSALAEGRKVPLLKDRNSWNLSLENLNELAGKNNASSYAKDSDGLTYGQYLSILLIMVPKETRIRRMLDMMELNTRLSAGYENFSFAGNVTEARFTGSVQIKPVFTLWQGTVKSDYTCEYTYVSDQTAAADE
ncbi:MAG: DUF5702 domain-containing protein [Lachnospiraceae bacterium]|jgi:hypothetical protein